MSHQYESYNYFRMNRILNRSVRSISFSRVYLSEPAPRVPSYYDRYIKHAPPGMSHTAWLKRTGDSMISTFHVYPGRNTIRQQPGTDCLISTEYNWEWLNHVSKNWKVLARRTFYIDESSSSAFSEKAFGNNTYKRSNSALLRHPNLFDRWLTGELYIILYRYDTVRVRLLPDTHAEIMESPIHMVSWDSSSARQNYFFFRSSIVDGIKRIMRKYKRSYFTKETKFRYCLCE